MSGVLEDPIFLVETMRVAEVEVPDVVIVLALLLIFPSRCGAFLLCLPPCCCHDLFALVKDLPLRARIPKRWVQCLLWSG